MLLTIKRLLSLSRLLCVALALYMPLGGTLLANESMSAQNTTTQGVDEPSTETGEATAEKKSHDSGEAEDEENEGSAAEDKPKNDEEMLQELIKVNTHQATIITRLGNKINLLEQDKQKLHLQIENIKEAYVALAEGAEEESFRHHQLVKKMRKNLDALARKCNLLAEKCAVIDNQMKAAYLKEKKKQKKICLIWAGVTLVGSLVVGYLGSDKKWVLCMAGFLGGAGCIKAFDAWQLYRYIKKHEILDKE